MKAHCAAMIGFCAPAMACEAQRDLIVSQLMFGGLDVIERGTVSKFDTGCHLRDLKLSTGSYLQVPIADVSWSGQGLEQMMAGAFGAFDLQASFKGLQMVAVAPEDAGLSYLMALQQRYNLIDGHVDVAFDPKIGQLRLDAFRIDFPDQSFIDITGHVSGDASFDNRSLVDVLTELTLPTLTISANNAGYLDSFVFSVLVGHLSAVDNPEDVVEAAKTQAIVAIGDLPDAVFDADTRAALARFVADGPMVRGAFTFELSGDPGLLFARLVEWETEADPFGADALSDLLQGTVIRATFQPWSPSK